MGHALVGSIHIDFFQLNTAALTLVLFSVLAGSVTIGVLIGRARHDHPDTHTERAGVVQGTLLGLVGLLLAFGMSMAVARYENRRELVVQEANDIGTAYLRAQMLPEPQATASLRGLEAYTDAAIVMANQVPDTESYRRAVATIDAEQAGLWTLAKEAVAVDPVGTGPRLYVETLNDTFDTHTSRVASLSNRVPTPVMMLLVFGSAAAVGTLAYYLTLLGKGLVTPIITAVVVLIILLVSFDLDRPRRGLILVTDKVLVELRESFEQPPP